VWKDVVLFLTLSFSIILIFSPLFVLVGNFENKNVILDSVLSKTLKSSELLRLAHACCVAASLPMAMDILLDYYLKFKNLSSSDRLMERSAIWLALVLPSIIYLKFFDVTDISMVYIVLNASQSSSIALLIWNAVMPEFARKSSHLLPVGSYMIVSLFVIRNMLRVYDLFFHIGLPFEQFIDYLTYSTYALAFGGGALWLFRTVQMNRNASYSHEEFQCFIFLQAIFAYSVCALILELMNGGSDWSVANETHLVSYAFLQLVIAVMVTVLPGRIAQMKLFSLNLEILSLKRMFVRYVSHEIRSPLNVVHAGLDILLGDLRSQQLEVASTMKGIIELAEDIYSASESAIHILNDLLEYEHLDAGSFQLDLGWKPLLCLMDGKLKWASFMAQRKGTDFAVEDLILSSISDSCSASKMDDDTDEAPPKYSCSKDSLLLFVDEGKVDQVIRNLLTNAFKFTPAGGKVTLRMSCKLNDYLNRAKNLDEPQNPVVGVFRLEVVDSGAGIAEEDQKKVFGEFAQFNRNELQGGGGSGLGLWVSRKIITMHQGVMGFQSEGKGQGSVFYFELPLFTGDSGSRSSIIMQSFSSMLPSTAKPAVCPHDEGVEDQMESGSLRPLSITKSSIDLIHPFMVWDKNPPAADPSSNDASQGKQSVIAESMHSSETPLVVESAHHKHWDSLRTHVIDTVDSTDHLLAMRFLVVDDSALNRKMVVRILLSHQQQGLPPPHIQEADDGDAAVRLVEQEMRNGGHFDFILMDNIMLRLNGPDAAAIIRKELMFKGIILGITGNVHDEQIADFLSHGANGVVTKPLTKAKLLDAMAQHFSPWREGAFDV